MDLRRLGIAAGLCLLASQSSAGGVAPRPLAPALPVELVLLQREVEVDVDAKATTVGTMLLGGFGAHIGSGRVKDAEARLVPLRDALLDYDFDDRLEKTLRGKLASEDISPAPHLSIVTAETRFEKGRSEPPSLALSLRTTR